MTAMVLPVCIGFSTPVLARESAQTTDALLQRIAVDTAAGKPLVATVYVALCDNDSQGIIPVKNRSICNGDDPSKNMYWKGNGISGYLHSHGWRRVASVENPQENILVREIWKKRMVAGISLRHLGAPRTFDAVVVANAYRGSRIHDAMKDYLKAVHTDVAEVVRPSAGIEIEAGGRSQVVGYVGHDYFMDVSEGSSAHRDLLAPLKEHDSTLVRGTFALACISNEFVRPYVTRDNVYILAMNNFLTYPSAWTIGGILEGIAGGNDGEGIYRHGARQFARSQKCGLKWAYRAFSYGP